jgi:3-phenylpropionate/trans-cinnamate dioxygenase ferredoxin reductase subunit
MTDALETDLLVVGSGPAGVAGASAFLAARSDRKVLLLSSDIDTPYQRPPLSKDFLRGDVAEADIGQDDAAAFESDRVQMLLGASAVALAPSLHSLTLADGRSISYTSCLLATGAVPLRPDIEGADLGAVHVLRSLRDARGLRSAAETGRRAVVVGSGFIGCEAAASLARLGLEVTMITTEDAPQRQRLGREIAQRISGWLIGEGVRVVAGVNLVGLREAGRGVVVSTSDGAQVEADLVLLATGVRPDLSLAMSGGLSIRDGRISVDASMQTSAPGVWAAGDTVSAFNGAAHRPLTVEHWGDALTMGEIAGRNAAGESTAWGSAPGFWSTIGDHTLKHSAWGDGFDELKVVDHGNESFTVWYGRDGRTVGVLTHEADADYERGTQLVEEGAVFPVS